MNFRLDMEEQVGETSVLVIRREGRYTRQLSRDPGYRNSPTAVVTERRGITLFAWNRGTLVEDRFQDRIVDAGQSSRSEAETIIRTITRLVRSCPTEDTQQARVADISV